MQSKDIQEIKKILKWGQIVLIVLAIFLGAEALGTLKDLRNINPAYNSISVNGEGEAVSIPDIATFSFTISVDSKVVSDAQAQVTEKMDTILSELKSLGIEDKDIKTTDYSVWPKYAYEPMVCSLTYCPPSRQVQDGYTASHSISVKVRKTEDAGKALSVVGDNGATNISSISFTVDDPDKIVNEARAEAIKDAKDKAEALSKELGVRLVRVVNFYDNAGGGVIPYYAEGLGGDVIKSTATPAPTVPVGENKVKANVTVVYEIR